MAAVVGAILITVSAPSLAQDRSSCLEGKDYLKAVRACSDIVRSNPTDASAYHMRGNILAKNGDLGQAIADYSKAIELNPDYAAAYNSRASAYVAKGDYAHAVADVTKGGEVGSRKAQPVKAKMAVKPKPKLMRRAAAKTTDTEQKEPAFNPFPK
jgi:Flp pilus assembly protein TadD